MDPAFETKVAFLVTATRTLDVPKILVLRRLTLRDRESRQWADERQINVVFNAILTRAMERLGNAGVEQARKNKFKTLLPPPDGWADEDIAILTEVADRLLGPAVAHSAAQDDIEALIAQDLGEAPKGRTSAPVKETVPLYAAQIGVLGKKPDMIPANADNAADKPFSTFNNLFDDTICGHVRRLLSLFQVDKPKKADPQLPFLLSPAFPVAMDQILRQYILPQMRASRRVQTMASSENWSDGGTVKLLAILDAGEVNNPILYNWDTRWNACKPVKVGNKVKLPPPEDDPWQNFKDFAWRDGYLPPTIDALPVFIDLIRYEVDAIEKCWKELDQLYYQEFESSRSSGAREGAFRDGAIKWATKMPAHVGEFLVLKAFYSFDKLDLHFMRRFASNFGRNDADRQRAVPFLTEMIRAAGG